MIKIPVSIGELADKITILKIKLKYLTGQRKANVKNEYDDATVLEKPQVILVDVIGVGSGVVDRLSELNLPVIGVNVGESPSSKKNYLNLFFLIVVKFTFWTRLN